MSAPQTYYFDKNPSSFVYTRRHVIRKVITGEMQLSEKRNLSTGFPDVEQALTMV